MDYQHQNVHDNFLEQFPLSTNKKTKGKELAPKNPRIIISEGFYDKGNWVRDAETSIGGLELFRKWVLQRKHDTPLTNVWEFGIGKLVVPSVFMDENLLKMLAKRYDLMLRVVKNHARDSLFRVTTKVIREVFMLNPNHALHEKIDLDDLQSRYDCQRVYLQGGILQEHFVKVGNISLVTSHTLEPLLKSYFNARVESLYITL